GRNPEEVVKRAREETGEAESGDAGRIDDVWKKEKRKKDAGAPGTEGVVRLGTMEFTNSREMFQTVKGWMTGSYLNFPVVNRIVPSLLDLVKKGHPEPHKMIGCGVDSFRVRNDTMCSHFRTFFIVRKDDSTADFCFRTCVNNILPLPENLKDQGGGVVAKHAHLMLLDLLKKGDPESEKKIGSSGVESFQVRIHPAYDSDLRSFYFVRGDGSMEDFCFIKCVDHIFPLTEKFKEQCVGPCSCHHEEDGEGGVTLGWLKFQSSTQMFSYFGSLNQFCPYESPITDPVSQTVVLALLKKGDPEWEKKVGSGGGLQSVRIQMPTVGSYPAYFVVRNDGSMVPFCFWTCIDNLIPLPKDYKNRCAGAGAGLKSFQMSYTWG
ncbi:unnamed protein product, partial [Linum tenue]